MKENRINKFFVSNWEFMLTSLGLTALILFSQDHIFFWDTVQLGSKHATFYFDNELALKFLPNEIDSGHIPAFGYVLAVLWKIFGKTLLVSHLYILPFAIGIAWQLNSLIKRFFKKKNIIWAMLIVVLDTTFLSQVSLVSPDIPLLFFFLFGLNSILKKKKMAIAIAFSFLFLISLRGMILTVPLFLFDLYLNGNIDLKNLKNSFISIFKTGVPYIPAAIIFIGFSWFHFEQKGWIGYHENSPWAVFFQKVGFQGMIKNAAIFGWRLLDFGRVFVWLVAFSVLVYMRKGRIKFSNQSKKLGVLFGLILIFLSIPAIIYFDLKGHRYFMPIYFSFSLFVSYLVLELIEMTIVKKTLVSFILIGLLSGSFWVYPRDVAQGWDSTLAHLPYYKLRKEMIDFIEKQGIKKESVGYDFPGAYPQKFLDLSKETWCFPEADLNKQEYILYSNVVNDFTNPELDELFTDWTVLSEKKSVTVELILFKNPRF